MKLQIVEYKLSDSVDLCFRYRYTLELAGRSVLQFVSLAEAPKDHVIAKLTASTRLLHDYDLEHYPKFNIVTNPSIIKKTIIFEQEVIDHYLKDLKIQQRIEEIEGDFTND